MSEIIDPRLLGIHAINSFCGNDSASRSTMMSSHFSQRLVLMSGTEKRIQTGLESDMSNYTFNKKMPVDGVVIKIIERYPRRIDADDILFSPETLVIYEDYATKEIGCISIPYHLCMHQHFGFVYEKKPGYEKIRPGEFIPKGTIFVDSPAVKDNQGYEFGREFNIAYMTHVAASEDGILISEDALPYLKFKLFETRKVEFGSKSFPSNLYGSVEHYKPFPEIGEYIREDGLLMMLREYNYDLSPVDISIYDVREPDFIFDTAVYARGGIGKVIDIKVFHDDNDNSPTPTGIMTHVDKYARTLKNYYREILDTERKIYFDNKKKYGTNNVVFRPEFHRLCVEARAILNEDTSLKTNKKLNKTDNRVPVDDYRVIFTIEYEIMPTVGFKLTDMHGGKGVICQIEKPENMPVDANGNRADIIMDSTSTIKRMNLGRLYEQYIGAAARDFTFYIKSIFGLDKHEKVSVYKANKIVNEFIEKNNIDPVYDRILSFYSLISPKQFNFYSNLNIRDRIEHIASILNDGIYLYIPVNNEIEAKDIVVGLEKYFPPTYGPVEYIGNSGKKVKTINSVRIGPVYEMLLDKIGEDYSACSSARTNYLGIICAQTKSEKYIKPYPDKGNKTISETEGRIYVGYTGEESLAEMMDRNNNPVSHREVVRSILGADKPTDIDNAINRDKIPLGSSKAIQLVKNIAICSGWKPVYEPEEP